MPKTASAALISFLGSGQPFIGADLYVFKLYSGQTIYVTSLDRSVIYTGIISTNPDFGTHTYVSLGQTGSGAPMIQRSKLSMAVGLTPSKVDVEIFARPGILIANQEILVTMAQGLWANAAVFVRRAFLLPSDQPASWDTPWPTNLGGAGDGTLLWFAGNVGRIDELGPLNCKFQARDLIWKLNVGQPHRLFGSACGWNLFDSGCTLNPASFQASGTVLSGSTTTVINTGLTNDASQPGAPVYGSNPLSQASTDYTFPATTYFAVATYVTNSGETVASAEFSINCTPNHLITLASPPSATGALFWNAYIGTEQSNEQRQNGSPIPIGTSWPEPTAGFYESGILPPPFPTNGWWSLGTITITYNSGVLSGQTASGVIEASNAAGQLSLRVPLPQAPSTSDTFVVFPGCDKNASTCGPGTGGAGGKFSNGIHFSGFPAVPVPENGA